MMTVEEHSGQPAAERIRELLAHITVVQETSTRDLEAARAARRETRETALLLALAQKRMAVLTDELVAQLTVHAAGDGYFCSWCEANADGGSQCAPTFAEVEHDAGCPLAGVPS